jgi:tRNA(Ile)-lysidine synthase
LCVDHQLRPGSSSEARKVSRWAKAAGLPVKILVRDCDPPRANIESAARDARYRLMGEWAVAQGIAAVYVGHTRDDQAETFLLRLARGSGVDGLSAMRAVAPYPLARFPGLALVRPMLGIERETLRNYLSTRSQVWLDDPMNADPRFARVKIRNAWPVLEAMGLSKARIADAAMHLARARAALDVASEAILARGCRFEGTEALIDPAALVSAPRELGLRALAQILMAVSLNAYRPRFERLERLLGVISEGTLRRGCTLHGCRIAPAPLRRAFFGQGTLLIRREGFRHNTMETKN